MHAFPKTEELGFFVSETLSFISFGQFTLAFVFDGGTSINCQYVVEFVDPAGNSSRHEIEKQLGPAPITFHRCIGEKVLAVNAAELRLSLHMESGSTLHFETELGPYECGQIETKHAHRIVF